VRALVTFALETEFAPWRKMREFRAEKWGVAKAYCTDIGGAEVGVVLTGVGPRQGGRRASEVICGESASIDLCISSGLTGSLKDEYAIAQVLAARRVLPELPHADSPGRSLVCSPALVSFADECGATVVDQFFTAERIVSRASEKRELGRLADAVEMESFDILHEAQAFGVPVIAIRAVSDLSSEDLPLDLSSVLSGQGEVSIPRVLSQAARRPAALPGLVKLGRQSKRAAANLAAFLDRYISTIATRMTQLEPATGAAN